MYLQTTRIVVIDDQHEEAMPVIEALGRLGVGCAYFPGTRVEDLPPQPLNGVRLVFLDMQLESQGSDREIGAHTARVFSKIISASGLPVLLVLWTKHSELLESFKQALFEGDPSYRSALFIVQMRKPKEASQIDPVNVFDEIKDVVANKFPLDFIWQWEQLAHNSTTEVTKAIAQLVARRTSGAAEQANEALNLVNWLTELSHILRYLINVTAGKNATEDRSDYDVLEVLTAMLRDRFEHETNAASPTKLSRLFELDQQAPSDDELAAINTMLLVAPIHKSDSLVRPGSVFVPRPEYSGYKKYCLFEQCGMEVNYVAEEVLQFSRNQEWFRLNKNIQRFQKTGRPTDALFEEKKQCTRALVQKCKPALLEISPLCDFSQRKRQVSKFLGGMLIPVELEKLIQRKQSIQTIERINLPGIEGIWCPVFSSLFTFSLSRPEDFIISSPLFRFRASMLASITSWYGAQSSRPGFMSLSLK